MPDSTATDPAAASSGPVLSSGQANRLKTKVTAPELPSNNSLATLGVAVVVIAALYFAREVLIPITVAILLSFVLQPLVARLRRLGISRVPSVLLAVFVALGIILSLGTIIGIQVAQLGSQASVYAETIGRKVDMVRGMATAQVKELSNRIGHVGEPPKTDAPAPQPAASDAPKPVPVEVHQPDPTPFELLERVARPVLSPLGSLGIILIVSVFILMQMEDLRDRLIRLFGSGDLHRTTVAMDDAGARLSRYFLTQLALNAGFGVIVALGLFLIGVPSPALFGIIAALLRFVPYVGAIGAGLLPAVLAAGVDPGWTMVLTTVSMFIVIELLVGQVVEPLLYGHSTGLSPVSVVISAIFWGWLWGPVGLILSMPLSLCLVVMGRHVENLQFIDVLLGDQPALTPAEGFYQRILAGDADEALDQAEVYLKNHSLSSYYDDVALSGLQKAANDSLRGVLSADQLVHVQEAVQSVVSDLGEHHEDEGPVVAHAPGAAEGTVLCVAGRGELDECACLMLAQLLAKHGLNARLVGADAVSRGTTVSLDMTGVDLVVVSYLEASGSLSRLRFLLRRLAAQVGSVPTLVGLWQADPALLKEERMRTVVGAERTTTTLQEAVAGAVRTVQMARSAQAAPADAEPTETALAEPPSAQAPSALVA